MGKVQMAEKLEKLQSRFKGQFLYIFYLILHLINLNVPMQLWDLILCSLWDFLLAFVLFISLKWEPLYTPVSETLVFYVLVKQMIFLLGRKVQFPSTFVKIFNFCSSDKEHLNSCCKQIYCHVWGRLSGFLAEILLTAWHFRFLLLDINPLETHVHLG